MFMSQGILSSSNMKTKRSSTKTIGMRTRSQKPFRDKINEAQTNTFRTVRVSICRDAATESKVKCLLNKISPEKRLSNTYDVYNFDYDPRLEPKRLVKKKKGRPKQKKNVEEIDTSEESDNSMKPIVKRIRKLHKRMQKNNKISEPNMAVDNISSTENAVVDKINEPYFKNISTNNPVILPIAENININKNIESPVPTDDPPVEESAANELADITRSFLEDLSDEDGDFIVTSPTHVDIISKMIMRKSNNPKPQNKIFNSTLNSSKVLSSPWRINVSSIIKKPQFFNVKDKSFTPAYNPDVMDFSVAKDLSSRSSSIDLSNRIDYKLNNTKKSGNNKIQTSLLNFVSGHSKKHVECREPRELFKDITSHNISPVRKVLGETNLNQSIFTPINLNFMHHSRISPKKKSSDDSLFGFSFISEIENFDESEKENIPQGKSPRKQKGAKLNLPTRISINEIKKVVFNENPVIVNPEPQAYTDETVTERIPSPFDDNKSVCLFDDPVEAIHNTKIFGRQYIRRNPKRKRILSETSCHSDDESDVETMLPVIKKRNKRTKEEEAEANRLAAQLNAKFEEIDKNVLCIE